MSLQNLVRIFHLRMFGDPSGDLVVCRACGYHVFKLLRCNAGEGEPLARQRTGPIVVLAVHVQEKGPALVDTPRRNYVTAEFFSRTARIRFPEILRQLFDLLEISIHRAPSFDLPSVGDGSIADRETLANVL